MEKEKNDLIQDIEITFDILIGELAKFDEKTLNQVPFKGSWTAGQTTEHIIICGNDIPDNDTIKLYDRSYDQKVRSIKELFLNFDVKFETDPVLEPSSPPHDKQSLLKKIKNSKERLKTIANTTNLEELCLDMKLPNFGTLTRYEWLRFISFHTQRHIRQIENIYSRV